MVYYNQYLPGDGCGGAYRYLRFLSECDRYPVPVFTACPTDATRVNDPGECGAVINYPAVTATDNCTGMTVVLISGLPSGSLFRRE